eukprot:6180302-Pleurochrysis_carterae.AAC.1
MKISVRQPCELIFLAMSEPNDFEECRLKRERRFQPILHCTDYCPRSGSAYASMTIYEVYLIPYEAEVKKRLKSLLLAARLFGGNANTSTNLFRTQMYFNM